jgi:hypothetical protein
MSIEWQKDTPAAVEARTGHQPAFIGTFIKMTGETWEKDMLVWKAQELRKTAKQRPNKGSPAMLHVALMPNVTTLDAIRPELYADIAKTLRQVNYDFGIPVMLRYAHEMNGNWNQYGQRPLAYKRSWIALTTAIRNQTNMTAMMWAP